MATKISPGRAKAVARPLGTMGALTLLLVAFLTIMVGSVIAPGLPSIAPALGVGHAATWLITLPSLGVVIFGAPAGRMIEHLGARLALCVGLVLYALLGLAAVLLHGPPAVFVDRLLLGGATALVMASGTTLISDFYSGPDRLVMIARQGMAIEVGGVIFLSLGGYLTSFGWAAPFALYGVALLFLAMVLAFVPATRDAADQETDAIAPQPQAPMTPVLIAALCSMIVFFTAFITLPFSLSRSGTIGLSEAQTGYFLSSISFVAVIFAAAMPRVAGRIGERGTLVCAFICYGAAHITFALADALTFFILGGIALGAGFGLSIPLVNHMTVERSPARLRGRNLAFLSVAIFLGQFLASPMAYVAGDHVTSFWAAAALAMLAALVGLGARGGDAIRSAKCRRWRKTRIRENVEAL